MPSTEKGKATHVPLAPTVFEESKDTREKCPQSLMESLYWQQMLGWAHTPPFIKADLTCPVRLHAPSSKETTASSKLYFEKKDSIPKCKSEIEYLMVTFRGTSQLIWKNDGSEARFQEDS
ncbi:hypothetical protein CEXT_298191 [Caerostris extrusa]|uniref:Uncharacterized protein n=1 Tax=Caerostris extrusa TaxID=172846 RepID=A0AAV4WYI8_CAEEX|nr:hypothetical protein CEXT_298191 [Caerostris extrusa]